MKEGHITKLVSKVEFYREREKVRTSIGHKGELLSNFKIDTQITGFAKTNSAFIKLLKFLIGLFT